MIVIAVAGGERILEIAEMIRRHFPKVKIAARAIDRATPTSSCRSTSK